MQALKALVIIMGVLIVLGTTVVVVTIYNRLNPGGEEASTATPAAPTVAAKPLETAPAAFGEARVEMPEGCRVVEMVPAGERLLLRLGSRPSCNLILVVDLATGRRLGAIALATQPQ